MNKKNTWWANIFISRQISLWVRESVGWKEQNLMMISTGEEDQQNQLKNYSDFCMNIVSSATAITLNSEWCIWILQHGKEDGSLQWVGGWLADQDKRVPSGANIFLSTFRCQYFSFFQSFKKMLLFTFCWCYSFSLDYFQPNPTVRAKMAAVKVVFSFSNISEFLHSW